MILSFTGPNALWGNYSISDINNWIAAHKIHINVLMYNCHVRYSLPVKAPHLRALDIRRDMLPVADLIEICFSSTLDEDGREYLRHIRRAATDPGLVRWLPGRGERVSAPLFGYVWEQDRRVVGNLSLIPIYKGGRWLYMIANVAVHPDYRRRGIARELTLQAIEHTHAHGVPSAWLQVRDDNLAAYHLYSELGFVERSRRSTWLSRGVPLTAPSTDLEVSPRRKEDWPLQSAWLAETYPLEATWNMSFNVNQFHPGWWNNLWQWMNGDTQLHWAARAGDPGAPQTYGFATWEPIRGYADALWIASGHIGEDEALRALLPHALQAVQYRQRPISINYPYGHGGQAFAASGFSLVNTLVWMEYRCN
jgi:ribosomal protein S18 acetylase RimI-like enzyme